MGVTGLWKLIEPCGKPVPVETLEGKILAVDISIWLHQVVKGFQDNKGAALNNAHLLGLFHRLCKLMYYRVKPIFVFDGCVPQLKKDTIARRQQQRSKLNSEADRIQTLLLQSLAKEKVVQQALGPNAELLLTSPVKSKHSRKEDTVDDMFKLPELPSNSDKFNPNPAEADSTDESFNDYSYNSNGFTTSTTEDSSFDESNQRHAYNTNIQAIDVKSKEFLQLPADVRHEILVDIKETRKQSSWGRLHELPSRSDDFSSFQMKRLLKRRDVQVSLESAEQEMGGRTLTYAELTNIFSEEGILETEIVEKGTKQITSDEHTRFLLVKDLKKKLAKAKQEPIKEEKEEIKEEEREVGKSSKNNEENCKHVENDDKKLGTEYDADLELALALSLEDDVNRVYDEKDYDYDSDESLKLSKAQQQQLQNAAKGPARSYMIEYAGMNKEEVAGILEKTQNTDDTTFDIERLLADADEKGINSTDLTAEQKTSESQELRLCVTDDSDATDSDLEEVPDIETQLTAATDETATAGLKECNSKTIVKAETTNKPVAKQDEKYDTDETDSDLEDVETIHNKTNDSEEECIIEETPPCLPDEATLKSSPSKFLNIEIDLRKPLQPDDDLFADIFQEIPAKEKTTETEDEATDSAAMEELKNNKTNAQEIQTPPKTEKILSILDELKQQAIDIKNIKLENIKLSDSAVIEISDDDTALRESIMKPEIIEVCDSDDNGKRCLTPPPTKEMQSPKLQAKSPNLKTPSKNHSITEFFNVDYVVKRTPDKPLEEDNEQIPKVKSPFFVRKTPKSGRKSGSNSPSPNKKANKANKTLFDKDPELNLPQSADLLDKDFMPLNEQQPQQQTVTEQDILAEAANILKSQKTTEELATLASDLAKERQELENERNRQDRMGMSVTQRMNADCQELLRLFGVPFIVAPMEAEAQCAFLDIVQLTNGTITDDSDIWLFGGQTVYKNFFAQNKHVLEFRSDQIEKDFNCDRKKLIQLACLVGSDYTTGIHGIGAVTALEILASFTPRELTNKPDESATVTMQTILNTLQRFRNWWQTFKTSSAPPGTSARLALQKKLKNIELYEGFPSTAVVEAYLAPKVDDNKEAFSWGFPDVESLREFARKNFGWTTTKTDDILKPVLKKLNEKRTQQSIRNYFNVKNALSLRQIRVSKRVQSAIEKMSGTLDSDDANDKPTKSKRTRKTNTAKSRKPKQDNTPITEPESEVQTSNELSSNVTATCSQHLAKGPLQKANKRVHIPETKQIIPQREKDLAEMEAKKKLAAEILKQSSKEIKKKRKA